MSGDTKRALRRHRKERKKAYAKSLARLNSSMFRHSGDEGQVAMDAKREAYYATHADNLKVCDGPCCKNVRRCKWSKHGGKTRIELELVPT